MELIGFLKLICNSFLDFKDIASFSVILSYTYNK